MAMTPRESRKTNLDARIRAEYLKRGNVADVVIWLEVPESRVREALKGVLNKKGK